MPAAYGAALAFVFALPAYGALLYLAANANDIRRAGKLGLTFGFVFFAVGLFWIFRALSGYIGLPVVPAALLAALLFLYLALYPALACMFARMLAPAGKVAAMFAAAAAWTCLETVREYALTGFPWFAAGYSQLPAGPFAGWAPVNGISAVTFALLMSSASLAALPFASARRRVVLIGVVVCFVAGGMFAKQIQWTTPGEQTTVSLLQGNVKQKLKWQKGAVEKALRDYLQMARDSKGAIIILPETALPMTRNNLPRGYLQELADIAAKRNGAVVAGMFEEDEGGTYNAAVAVGDFETNSYRKIHLTPYGEYLPFGEILSPFLQREWMAFFTLSPGASQKPLRLPGVKMGAMICYEDIFGEELRARMAESDFLANLTNDGWFDGSMMAVQHIRYSQARALEAAKDTVRATNTGVTAFINHKGEIISTLPQQTTGILEGKITLRTGATPYAKTGCLPVLLLALLIIGTVASRAFYSRPH